MPPDWRRFLNGGWGSGSGLVDHQAKTHLSRLVQRAHAGEEIVIRRGKVPMAKLVRYDAAPVARTPGRLRGQIVLAPDFDDLDDEMGDLFGVGR